MGVVGQAVMNKVCGNKSGVGDGIEYGLDAEWSIDGVRVRYCDSCN